MLRAQECEYSTGPAKKAAQPAAASAEQGQVCRLALSRLHDLAACMVQRRHASLRRALCIPLIVSWQCMSASKAAAAQDARCLLYCVVFCGERCSALRVNACCSFVESVLHYILLQSQTSADHGTMDANLFSWHAQHLYHLHRTARLS